MDRNRNDVGDHPEWPFSVIPWEQAELQGVKTVSREGINENRHKMASSEFFVFTERTVLPIDENHWLEILPGFATDWASVPVKPAFLRHILKPNTQDVRRAAVTHDALYNWKPEYIGWHMSNDIFKRIMLEDGSSKTKARLMHWGVETSIGLGHWETDALFDQENRAFSIIHNRVIEGLNFEEISV